MYEKRGCIESATKVFYEMPPKEIMTWTALIGGFATSGHSDRTLQVFNEMERSGGEAEPVTLVGVLTACSHAGLAEKGRFDFNSLSRVYNVEPTVEHYGCMVDGLIGEAEKLIGRMPMAPDYFVLGNLLGACGIH